LTIPNELLYLKIKEGNVIKFFNKSVEFINLAARKNEIQNASKQESSNSKQI